MKATLPAVALCLLFAVPAFAKEVAGVNYPDTAKVGDKELKLNGVGLRKKVVFKVYTVGLYLETPSKDAAQIIAADETKRVRMYMLRDLDKKTITEAISDGFKKNAGAKLPALQPKLDSFNASIPDLKKGDELILTYVPGKGTEVKSTKGGEDISVEGKDFADALFSVWLGKDPVDGGLKDGMLGKD
ncbi:chalcone isomerase family protein [Myxococcus sp. CA051A]|uniref:Chalcone isomerase domain-containing protein n=1 Tax=Myxococcus llanfairpwllgwyngyllgogerychwyrndrobwllllantysiliogogogochensis TaxID=2590453 RepID=A0A540X0U7_9BACT|nr:MULTISPECIES: chalcone isomerase family protein [Myxococcus]NTX01367.1 chalcone isomerase family protein [Myxococcus sp. CA040A]NTX15607.1 chalcone isomerase family protein [Myxococcus sp. CA056]NTX32942.1 chalcone isomerase family protein [Myxococcus sp. CA033]NTX49962.1 chalcone isomerase family protein [Myxococcus sp. CA039A]NTX59994.1 chalcone isomerase family protein [Myxococcus sp. CA051A]